MSKDPGELRLQLEQLKAENERLRQENEYLRAQRKEYLDYTFGPADPHILTEEQIAAALKDPNRVSFSKFLADLGITRKNGPNPQ